MFRKSLIGATAIVAVGLLAMGCSDSSSDDDSGGSASFTDTYPGPNVDQSWVGDDQRALSHNNRDVANFEFYPCYGSDVGIVTYTTDAGTRLMASYYDGSTFTTPVEIIAENYNPAGGVGDVQVVWLNPTATDATFRRGDAIMMFRRDVLDNPATTAATVLENGQRLCFSYFTSSLASTAQSGNIKHGFNTLAEYVTLTPQQITGPPTQIDPVQGNYGFISDSNFLSHGAGDAEISGQDTTFLYALWFAGNGGTTSDMRMFAAQFVLTSANTTNSFSSQTTFAGQASTNEGVQVNYTAHNGTVFYTATDDGGTGHTLGDHINFDASVGSGQFGRDEAIGTGGAAITVDLPTAENVYGPDHGLRDVIAIWTETGFGNTATTDGEDQDVMLNVIDPTVAATANAPREIDEFSGATTLATQAADADGVSSRIALGAEWIGVAFNQNNILDTAAAGAALLNNPKGTVVQVALAGGAARTTALSASAAIPLSELSGAANVGGVTGGDWMEDLASGQGHPACNVQSDHLSMSVIFDQTTDNGTAAAVEQMRVNTLTAVLDSAATPAAVPTTTGTTSTATIVDSVHATWLGVAGFGAWGTGVAEAFDDGAGGAAVAYLHQEFQPDATRVAATVTYVSRRVYFWRANVTTLISSLPPTLTPHGKQAGAPTVLQVGITNGVDANGDDAGTGVHIFWNQFLQTTGGRSALASVFWDKAAAVSATPPAVGDQFLPVRTTTGTNDPFIIDQDLSDDAALIEELSTGSNGADIYFTQGGNLWWNTFSGTSWLELSGLSDPQLVSHDSNSNLVGGAQVLPRGDQFTNCNSDDVMNLWTRQDADTAAGGDLRLHARPSN